MPVLLAHAYYTHLKYGVQVEYIGIRHWKWEGRIEETVFRPERWYNFDAQNMRVDVESPFPYVYGLLKTLGFNVGKSFLRMELEENGIGSRFYWKDHLVPMHHLKDVLLEFLTMYHPGGAVAGARHWAFIEDNNIGPINPNVKLGFGQSYVVWGRPFGYGAADPILTLMGLARMLRERPSFTLRILEE